MWVPPSESRRGLLVRVQGTGGGLVNNEPARASYPSNREGTAMRKTEILAYTAGIIDGEGSIHIYRTSVPDYRTGFNYQLRVNVGNTQEWLCQWLKMQFGGSVSSFAGGKAHWKRAYIWQLKANQIIPFLKMIMPYLQLKQRQAEIALEFQKINPNIKNSLITKEESQILKRALFNQMREINKKCKNIDA